MNPAHALLDKLDRIVGFPRASAHCDIPCGIYDPHELQLNAHTVLRMTQLIEQLPDELDKGQQHRLARYTAVKEQHGESYKNQLRVLWGDYFKEKHLDDFPGLHELVWEGLKLGSTARQEVDMRVAKELVENSQRIAEIFWETKGRKPVRVKSPWPTPGEVVLHK